MAPPLRSQDTVISDTTFSTANWSIAASSSVGGATHSAVMSPSGGNPGSFRSMTHTMPGSPNIFSQVVVWHQYGVAYNPAVSGPIATLDFSMDRKVISLLPTAAAAGAAVGERFALYQGGVMYFVNVDSTFTSTSWNTFSRSGLVAASFLSSPGGLNPDFSVAGAPITFGYIRSSSNGSATSPATVTTTKVHGIDNFVVRIHPPPDADGDGLTNGDETLIHGTNPNDADTDDDGLEDGDEVAQAGGGTCPSPLLADSDSDGLSDGLEIASSLDLCDSDSDDDGLTDGFEASHGTDPANADTDGDGLADGDELARGTDPLDDDSDDDGLGDSDEVARGTDPLDDDSDGDGLGDGDEIARAAFGACPSPLVADSDMDGIDDGAEVLAALDPCDSDFDNDGLADGLEAGYGTHPAIADTDSDGLADGTEVDTAQGGGCPDPVLSDSDFDTLGDGFEVATGTNPCDGDTDGDSVPDNVDPIPTIPGVTSGFLEEELRDLGEEVLLTSLAKLNGPNANANKGRRNALANRAANAANAIAAGDEATALAELAGLLDKIDGVSPPPDWMHDSPEKTALAAQVQWLITLISY